MKYSHRIILVVVFSVVSLLAANSPIKPTGAINDFSSILSTESINNLSLYSADIYKKTGVAIVFASFDSFNDKSTKEFASDIFREWGIGGRDKELGIIVIASKHEGDVTVFIGNGMKKTFSKSYIKNMKRSAMSNFILKDKWDEGIRLIYSQLAYRLAISKKIEPYTFLAFSEDYLLEQNIYSKNIKNVLFLIFPFVIIFIIIFLLPNKHNVKPELKIAFGGTFNSKGFGGFKTWMVSGDEYLK